MRLFKSVHCSTLTIKAFKKDYFEAKEELYKLMNELADQIKRIIF